MRYYSEVTVKEILADYDEDVGGIFGELSDYDHIDIPEKHGRLIDADKAIERARELYVSGIDSDRALAIAFGESLIPRSKLQASEQQTINLQSNALFKGFGVI